jgi:hypothetical protein
MSGDLADQWTGPRRPIHRCPGYSFDSLKTHFLRKTASSVDRKRNTRYTKYFKAIGVTSVKCNSNAQNTKCCSCMLIDFCCHLVCSVFPIATKIWTCNTLSTNSLCMINGKCSKKPYLWPLFEHQQSDR